MLKSYPFKTQWFQLTVETFLAMSGKTVRIWDMYLALPLLRVAESKDQIISSIKHVWDIEKSEFIPTTRWPPNRA